MLRKRSSYKPNLKQACQPQQASTTTTATTSDGQSQPVAARDSEAAAAAKPVEETTPVTLTPVTTIAPEPVSTTTTLATLTPTTISQEDQRVQEAITQLTGQKFEPIKSLSLRSSANKNVKLKDLLFFNPPMTKDQKRHKKSVILAKKTEQKKAKDEEQSKNDSKVNDAQSEETNKADTVDEEPSLVPKVKMGPEGQLILDESSTIINRKNIIKEKEAIVEDNEDIISRTNYDSYRRRPTNASQTKWSLEDTKKFYHALTILGTDFSMMESLLFTGLRSRTELHKKFKREERVNKLKVDIALSNRISLNSEELEDLKELFHN